MTKTRTYSKTGPGVPRSALSHRDAGLAVCWRAVRRIDNELSACTESLSQSAEEAVSSRLLITIPLATTPAMTAAISKNHPQYWTGWRTTRVKCRP
jgi:hypothetical protein